jgi:DNA-directed RNA polymerase specialized sigma24 family protein
MSEKTNPHSFENPRIARHPAPSIAPTMPPDPRLASARLSESSWLHRLALRLVAEPERAADAAQDTLARELERPPAATVPLRRWLAAVLRNVVRQERRGHARLTHREH